MIMSKIITHIITESEEFMKHLDHIFDDTYDDDDIDAINGALILAIIAIAIMAVWCSITGVYIA